MVASAAVTLAALGSRPEGMHALGAAWLFTLVVGIGFALIAVWCLTYASVVEMCCR
jgi:hypothetical protein